MSDKKLPPAPGLPQERSRTATPSVGGTPPAQPKQPVGKQPHSEHPVAQSDADVSHAPAVHENRKGWTDQGRSRDPAIPGRVPRADDKGPEFSAVGMPKAGAPKEEGSEIRFDWYPKSVNQVVSLNHGEKRVESIMGRVLTPSTDSGPTSLTFRKVLCGESFTSGKALHTGSIDLVGPINADISGIEQKMAMSSEQADCNLEDGDCIVADFSGNMASARGTVVIKVVPR